MLDNMCLAHLLTILRRSQNSICDYSPVSQHGNRGKRAYGYAQGDMVWAYRETCTLLAHSFCCLLQSTAWGTHRPSAGAVWLCRTPQPTPAQLTTLKPMGPKHKNPKTDLTITAPGITLISRGYWEEEQQGRPSLVLLLSTLPLMSPFLQQ